MRILALLLFFMLFFPFDSIASCWDGFDGNTKEKTFVKPDWVKTQVSKTITAYLEVEEIYGGLIQRQWLFIDDKLFRFEMSIFSIALPSNAQKNIIWGPCYDKLGAPNRRALSLGHLSWIRPDFGITASGGFKNESYWVQAMYIRPGELEYYMDILLEVGDLVPKIYY